MARVGKVEVPALIPQRLVGSGVWRLVGVQRPQRFRLASLRQHRQRVEVQHLAAMPLQHRHEHLVAAFGALHQHRGGDRHHHTEDALPTNALTNVVDGQRRVRAERLVIRGQQFVVMCPARLGGQRGPEEVRQIGQRRAPGDRLPVDHRQCPSGPRFPEQHVVQAVVAVHQPHRVTIGRLGRQQPVKTGDQLLANLALFGRHGVGVPVGESGI
jgi:hypothetical protein